MRQLNAASLDLIREFEGLRLDAYLCPAGKWTIGYGHTSYAGKPEVSEGMRITEEEANAILARDMAKFTEGVLAVLKRRPTNNQLGAFASLCMNIGLGAFSGSTAVKRFNAGDMAGAADALTWWNKATVNGKKVKLKGLVRRREAERQLFLKDEIEEDDYSDPVEAKPAGPVTGGEAKKAAKSTTNWASIIGSITTGAGAILAAMSNMDPTVQAILAVGAVVSLLAFGWVIRERLKKIALGV